MEQRGENKRRRERAALEGGGGGGLNSHPRGRGPREHPPLLSGSSHPQFPSLSPAGSRKHAVALVQPGSPAPPSRTQSRMESGSRGEVEVSSPGFISCGRHNTLHKPGGLKQTYTLTLLEAGGTKSGVSTLPPESLAGESMLSLFQLPVLLAPWLVTLSLIPHLCLHMTSRLRLLLCLFHIRTLVFGFQASHIFQGDLFIFRSLT